MHRAIRALAFVLVCLALLPTGLGTAAETVNLVNGIGLIDYGRRPDFKVGSWVKYRLTGSSDMGMRDNYEVLVLIAGEERFWDEECFWVETHTRAEDKPPMVVATLMSYAIFQEEQPIPRLQLYSRKTITDIDQEGRPIQVVNKRNTSSMKNRKPPASDTQWYVDTLGVETVTVPHGTYSCRKVTMQQGIATSTDVGDSTVRTEVREERTLFMDPKIPITGLVREDIVNSIKRKVWQIGRSQDAPERVMDHATGSAVLVDYGTGMEAHLVPQQFRSSMREQEKARKPAAKKAPAPSSGKSGSKG